MDELIEQLKQEIERIQQLPLAEQPAAYGALRDLLDATLNSGS
mgnify:CR=1 FL=1|jgi:hypothetical protein